MMFADVGHGLLLLAFSLYLILTNGGVQPASALAGAYRVRYVLLMMAVCSVFNGVIYNDLMSIPLNLFGSRWHQTPQYDQLTQDSVYPFGIDPIWYKSSNTLVFLNSFKMKISVIFGVIQMIGGVLLKGANTLHYRKPIDFFFEFIP
jgi:V-type H+-transporting ATPase subunit a